MENGKKSKGKGEISASHKLEFNVYLRDLKHKTQMKLPPFQIQNFSESINNGFVFDLQLFSKTSNSEGIVEIDAMRKLKCCASV